MATCQVLHKLREELQIEEIYSIGGERQWHNARRLPRAVELAELTDTFSEASQITTLITATNHSGETFEPAPSRP